MSQLTEQGFANFFKYYAEEDQQKAATEILFQALLESDPKLLEETHPWIVKYREEPPAPEYQNPIDCPYQSQLDNASGEGYRECFSSSCAMVAMYYGKIKDDDAYCAIRSQYGDSTDAQAQLRTLRALGLKANFITNGTYDDLKKQIQKGRPTPVGWLHKGSSSNPTGGGHYSVILGNTDDSWILHDPYGEANVSAGGYCNHTKGKFIEYSYKNWNPRWAVEGDGSGWFVDIYE